MLVEMFSFPFDECIGWSFRAEGRGRLKGMCVRDGAQQASEGWVDDDKKEIEVEPSPLFLLACESLSHYCAVALMALCCVTIL